MSAQGQSWFQVRATGEVAATNAEARPEPSGLEVAVTVGLALVLHILFVCRAANFWEVAFRSNDNQAYLHIAAIIRTWHPPGTVFPAFFWGFPYAIAGVSTVLSLPPLAALVLVSIVSSLAVSILVCRLYGGWVAVALYSFINYHLIFISVEGGSELPFMCLLFASLLAARSERWNLAALLAALGTTVRPVGLIALVAFALVLGMRRSYRRLAEITLIGLGIGLVYVIPVWIILGSPVANFTRYQDWWGPQGRPLTFPFGALIPSFIAFQGSRWPKIAESAIWLALALAGTAAMWLPRQRPRFPFNQPEIWFASIYTLFFLSYNYSEVYGDLPRFLMPITPLLLFSFRDWIPRDRRVLWPAVLLSALLASAAQVGFNNVFGFKLP